MTPRHATFAACLLAAGLISGCAVGPAYKLPSTPQPAAFKEAGPWQPAAPADTLDRGPWWTLFRDPLLNDLAASVEVNNQNVAAAVANYAQARALVQQQRASLFPTVSLNAGADKSGGPGSSSSSDKRYHLTLGGSWEPDVWGRLRAGVNGASANAQASAADLAAARLSAQGELAANYFTLRETDAQRELLAQTIAGYQRVLQITQNRFNAGIAAKSDVLQAQTQLANAQSDDLTLVRQRAQLEHAIAILLGKAPADFTLAAAPWQANVPDVPAGVPSALLQRRPDIAAAERRVAAANEQIGIARAAYYPNIGLSGSYGTSGSSVSNLFSVSNAVWSLGLSAAQSIFNGGATRAAVAGAEAAQQAATARYRQTVLVAFGDVEDQLAATHVLSQQTVLRRQAADAANLVEEQMLNRYKAGQVSYTEVVQAQATALSARRALVQAQADRQTTAVALIQALGGGWHIQ
ncbi:efflux transporter outer membrane subunit [Massilia sp. R2A-15]|uniref:efflux transporter outer membrane subunit n=1 Tax=Massilia sp. R2A-15 TaxID=3064278 RepID=UPI0027355689|nr:efflux transporter outer membrane subunit [Massilia sp. R2A-15]WLI87475.1 efflux transporter outer membrane subunit [Massilia sp. R2A-15]